MILTYSLDISIMSLCVCSTYTHRLTKTQAVDSPVSPRSIHIPHLDFRVDARPRSSKHYGVANLMHRQDAVRMILVLYPSSTYQVPRYCPRRLTASPMLIIAPVQTVDHRDGPHLDTRRRTIIYIKLIVDLQYTRSKGTYLPYNNRHDH